MIDSKTQLMKHRLILFYKQLECVGLHWMRAPHVERRRERASEVMLPWHLMYYGQEFTEIVYVPCLFQHAM